MTAIKDLWMSKLEWRDPYFWHDVDILENKLGIKNQEKLTSVESAYTHIHRLYYKKSLLKDFLIYTIYVQSISIYFKIFILLLEKFAKLTLVKKYHLLMLSITALIGGIIAA